MVTNCDAILFPVLTGGILGDTLKQLTCALKIVLSDDKKKSPAVSASAADVTTLRKILHLMCYRPLSNGVVVLLRQ